MSKRITLSTIHMASFFLSVFFLAHSIPENIKMNHLQHICFIDRWVRDISDRERVGSFIIWAIWVVSRKKRCPM